jgi:hypothetical protein
MTMFLKWDGLSVIENQDMMSQFLVGMLCHRVASSKGRIIQEKQRYKKWGRSVTGKNHP